jgi:hypothetical protein
MAELVSIVDFTSRSGLAAPFPADTFGETWSSSDVLPLPPKGPGTGLGVAFTSQYNEVYPAHTDDTSPARCVRTGGAPPPLCYRAGARFVLDSDEQATDRATGFAWKRHVLPGQVDWSTAKASCAARGGGWRLPSVHELETIVDHTVFGPAIDAVTFPDTPVTNNHPEIPDHNAESSTFWTSSASAFDASHLARGLHRRVLGGWSRHDARERALRALSPSRSPEDRMFKRRFERSKMRNLLGTDRNVAFSGQLIAQGLALSGIDRIARIGGTGAWLLEPVLCSRKALRHRTSAPFGPPVRAIGGFGPRHHQVVTRERASSDSARVACRPSLLPRRHRAVRDDEGRSSSRRTP